MPKLKAGTILSTPAEDAAITAVAMADPDAAPFTNAQWAQAKPVVRRGRPLGSGRKIQVTLRLDSEVLECTDAVVFAQICERFCTARVEETLTEGEARQTVNFGITES